MKTWNQEMSEAYGIGLADGKAGLRRGRPNDFEACYEQGYQHGKTAKVDAAFQTWDRARILMAKSLATI